MIANSTRNIIKVICKYQLQFRQAQQPLVCAQATQAGNLVEAGLLSACTWLQYRAMHLMAAEQLNYQVQSTTQQ